METMDATELEKLKKQARACLVARQYAKAVFLYEDILESFPNDVRALDDLGFLYYMNGKFEKARSCCERSLKVCSDNHYAMKGLGLCLVRLGFHEKGIEKLKASIAVKPDYFDSYHDLAVSLIELRRFDEAESYILQAAAIDAGKKHIIEKLQLYHKNQKCMLKDTR